MYAFEDDVLVQGSRVGALLYGEMIVRTQSEEIRYSEGSCVECTSLVKQTQKQRCKRIIEFASGGSRQGVSETRESRSSLQLFTCRLALQVW